MTQGPSKLPKITRPAFLRLAAFAMLFAGLAIAAWVDQSARRAQALQAALPDDMVAAAPLAPADSKRYGYQMGQLSGNIGLLADGFARAAGSIGHGRPLAVTVAVFSFAVAGALLFAADKAAASKL